MCIRGHPRSTCHRKLSLGSLNFISVLHLWLAYCLFLYLGFKGNDPGYLFPDCESKETVEMSIFLATLRRDLLQIYSMILILFSLQYK